MTEQGETRELDTGGDPFGAVAEYLSNYRVAPLEGLPPFAGGAVGMFGYDLVRTVERLPEPNPDDVGTPDMALMVSDALIVFDHLSHSVTILVNAFVDGPGDVDAAYEQRGRPDRARPRPARRAGPAPRRRRRRGPPIPARAFESNMTQARVRGGGREGEGVHPRGRRLPGRPFAPLGRTLPGRARSLSTAACAS